MTGFGKPKQTEESKLIERMVHYCQKRNPEALDRLLDSVHMGHTAQESERLSYSLTHGTVTQIQSDIDTLSWFCGYMASEINRSEDNDRSLPVTGLAKKLIQAGMQPFEDFAPYPGRRLVIINDEKVKTLPEALQTELRASFDLTETSGEEFDQINEAIRQELIVTKHEEDELKNG